MQNQYIGIHEALVTHDQKHTRLIVEMNEATRYSKLIIDGIRVNQVFASPEEAYRKAVDLLNLAGQTVELEIMVAVNVMSTDAAEQVFRDAGVEFDEPTVF